MYVLYCKIFSLGSCPLGTDRNLIKVFLALLKTDPFSAVRVDTVCCQGVQASLASCATVTQPGTARREKMVVSIHDAHLLVSLR